MISSENRRRRSVAVVGGGITGLAAAHRLQELVTERGLDWRISLWEASARLGGVLQTERRDGFLIERAGDMFTTRQGEALALCRRIGLQSELIGTNDQFRHAFIWSRNRLHRVPEGFALMRPTKLTRVLATPLLSWPGKLRLLAEPLVPARRDASDESLQSFATRRLGREAYERLVQPLIGGIYTADPSRLSMAATMNEFLEMERKHGSLFRGGRRMTGGKDKRAAEREASGARYGQFLTPRLGMEQFVETLAEQLRDVEIHLQQPVRAVQVANGSSTSDRCPNWRIDLESGEQHVLDGVLVATPAPVASRQLADACPQLAGALREIPYAGVNVAILAYHRSQIAHRLDGFGLVIPLIERRQALAVSFASVKFAGRAPKDHVLLRVFLGGACQPELNDLEAEEVLRIVRAELADLIGASGEPRFSFVVNWQGAMPQYHVGHLDLVQQIERDVENKPGLQLAGNAYRGVGIPFCIRSGEAAAQRMVEQLTVG